MNLFDHLSGAIFSPCMLYRYKLWRMWDESKPPLLFVMLNPSTADDVDNDATVERCQRRALSMGYGGLMVGNIFAYRSTDPGKLYEMDDPVGPDNDAAILEMASRAGDIVCGWGTDGALHNRGETVIAMIRDAGYRPKYLVLNQDGSPRHPLYVSYDTLPQEF